MSKNLEIVIGPNGFGKTYYLNEIKKTLDKKKITYFDLNSEIKTEDELKDTKDSTKSMEFIINEILISTDYGDAKDNLVIQIQKCIDGKKVELNNIFDDVLNFNENTRKQDFVEANKTLTIKKPINVNKSEINSMGSGQRMLLLLKLTELSDKEYIFLDEPEAHSHPSMLHEIAKTINELVVKNKKVYIATHSPILVSLLDFDFENLKIINDTTHIIKNIDFEKAILEAKSTTASLGSLSNAYKNYYKDSSTLMQVIKQNHLQEFLFAMFAKKIYMCEGIYDESYIKQSLCVYGKANEDYYIFKTFGKFPMLILILLLRQVNENIVSVFDSDSNYNKDNVYISFNNPIQDSCKNRVKMFDPNLETEIGYKYKNKNDKFGFTEYISTNSNITICDVSEL